MNKKDWLDNIKNVLFWLIFIIGLIAILNYIAPCKVKDNCHAGIYDPTEAQW